MALQLVRIYLAGFECSHILTQLCPGDRCVCCHTRSLQLPCLIAGIIRKMINLGCDVDPSIYLRDILITGINITERKQQVLRNIGYFVLFVEGIVDAITTYVGLSLGYPEANILLKYVWHIFGKEVLTILLVWWAFYRIRILKNMHKEGVHVIADLFLIGAIIHSAYIVLHNLGVLYLCLQFGRCVVP